MLPPPAPTARMSSMGTRMGRPYSSAASRAVAGRPSATTAMSRLVPPTSQVIRSRSPTAAPSRPAAATPAAGPERIVLTGRRRATAWEATPPLDWISSTSCR